MVGGTEEADKLENERQINQKWFKEAGFDQVKSKNFSSVNDAIGFLNENKDKRWILKQNGDAPKSISYMGKFEDNVDLIDHLEDLKRS